MGPAAARRRVRFGMCMDRSRNTIMFLRMAAIELRKLAENAPEIRDQLVNMAEQLEAEADDLAKHPQP